MNRYSSKLVISLVVFSFYNSNVLAQKETLQYHKLNYYSQRCVIQGFVKDQNGNPISLAEIRIMVKKPLSNTVFLYKEDHYYQDPIPRKIYGIPETSIAYKDTLIKKQLPTLMVGSCLNFK